MQRVEREQFVAAQVSREGALVEEQAAAVKQYELRKEQEKANFERSKEEAERRLGERQSEDRKQFGLKQKDEVKRFNVDAERRRTELANKQEEDRKAMFAMRKANQQGADVAKPEEKKATPQQERDQLEKQMRVSSDLNPAPVGSVDRWRVRAAVGQRRR